MIRLLILFLLLTSPVYGATQQVVTSGTNDDLNTATTVEYIPFFGNTGLGSQTWAATEQNEAQVFPTAGTIDDLRVFITADPDNGASVQSYTFLFSIDAASGGYGTFDDTTLGCAISDGSTTCQDSDGFSVVAGDLVSFQHLSANTPTVADAKWTWTWNPTTEDESILLMNSSADTSNATTNFPMHGAKSGDTASTDVHTVMPTAGTFKTMVGWVRTDPGTGTDSWNFAFGSVDCDVGAAEASYPATCSSDADTQAVVGGDLHVLVLTETGSNAATTLKAGIVFDPTTAGEWIIAASTDDNTPSSNTEFGPLASGDFTFGQTEDQREGLAQAGTFATAFTIEDIRVHREASIGTSGDIEVYTLRVQQTNTALTCTVDADVDTQNCNGSSSISIANDDLVQFEINPDGSPTTGDITISFTGFIPPSVAGAAYTHLMLVD